jgi:hypothetical protein
LRSMNAEKLDEVEDDDQLDDEKLPVDETDELLVLNELPPKELVEPPNPPKELVEPPKPELLENDEPPVPEPPPEPGPAPGPEPGPDCVPVVECEVLMLQFEGETQMQWSFWHSPHSRLFMQCIMHCCA